MILFINNFCLYRNGDRIEKISIARPFVIKKLSTIPPPENEDKLFQLLDKFKDFPTFEFIIKSMFSQTFQ
ncbi:hypothetical protein [Rosettibacter firmus]|uniref:hypothetical protein n=1 Tax=Rosettibacter firmus TaxID=3111522 RepID=UPI00336BFF08